MPDDVVLVRARSQRRGHLLDIDPVGVRNLDDLDAVLGAPRLHHRNRGILDRIGLIPDTQLLDLLAPGEARQPHTSGNTDESTSTRPAHCLFLLANFSNCLGVLIASHIFKPRMMYFCPNKVSTNAGSRASTAVALIRFHCRPISLTNCAMTTVITGVRSPVRMSANRNSFQVNSQHSTANAEIAGMADGSATRRNAPQRVQPSISAAYSIDGSMPSKKPFISHEKKQMCTAMYGSSRPI